MKGRQMSRNVLIEMLNCGIACQPSQSKQPLCVVSRKLSETENFSSKNSSFPMFTALSDLNDSISVLKLTDRSISMILHAS